MPEALPDFDTIADDFAFIDDWDEKYRYLIDLGRRLPPLSAEEHDEHHKVRGCASQVWLIIGEGEDGAMTFKGDSDAAIVKGLVALVMSLYEGKRPDAAHALDAQGELKRLDLDNHITPQRSNGLASMIARIRDVAAARTA